MMLSFVTSLPCSSHVQATFTEGRFGQAHVQVITLHNWQTTLLYCIVTFTHDADGRPDGLRVLVQCGLYDKITKGVAQSEPTALQALPMLTLR